MSSLVFSPLRVVAGTAVGVGVGQSVADAISPITRELANQAWAQYLSMPVSVIEAASVVASGERTREWGLTEAASNGFDEERFDALVDMLDTAPDLSTLFDLLHRGLISEGEFREGARKQYIEPRWIDALLVLAQRVLSPAEAAAAWQQGYMEEGEASAEAELSGVSPERSRIQRELAGLPPGPEAALTMLRRGIIDEGEFEQMIREGNTKRKYTGEYLELRQALTTAANAASLHLKGHIDEGERDRLGALLGYDHDAMERLYLDRGRPATVRQAHIGFARGGRLPEAGDSIEETIRRSVEQSNIRSEWFDILFAQRYTYPSAFVLRALASDGTFTREQTEEILIESGWKPEWAEAASTKWAGGEEGPATKWADRARSRLFTAAHSDYLDGNATEDDARALLARIGAIPGEVDTIIALWNLERERTRKDLTQAQIVKLYKKGIWPREQAQGALEDLGMKTEDAANLLSADSPSAG